MKNIRFAALAACCLLAGSNACPQTPADHEALKGLAPVTVLLNTDAGKDALDANYKVTAAVQTGTANQPILLPFPAQQIQALQDAYITGANLAQLSDGLGSTLGAAYIARFHYASGKQYTKLPQSVADLVHSATSNTGKDSNAAKYLFANATSDGKMPVDLDLKAILSAPGSTTDVFGKAYHLPAGSAGADAYGDSRPFQTEKDFASFTAPDYFNVPSGNVEYDRGPAMNLTNSPSYPSGHTTYGFTGAVLLAVLVPERYAQMITRGAEYGNDRIIVGAHYAMDVLGGRTLALYDMAHMLAQQGFQDEVKKARADLIPILEAGCGATIAVCAQQDTGRFNHDSANGAFYESTLTYNLPVVYPANASVKEDVGKLAPEAGYLLTVAFPWLTLQQADAILTETEGPGGGFLDNGSSFGVYSRLNLVAAGQRAAREGAGNQR